MPADEEHRREQQLERMRDAVDRQAEESRARAQQESLEKADLPQDEPDVRAKSSGHKKKTADKWNQ